MLNLRPVAPVKYLIAAFWSDQKIWERALERIEEEWGALDLRGAPVEFTESDYYEPEMGPEIHREFVAVGGLMPPEYLAAAKIKTNAVEEEFAVGGRRRVNLDIGYMDLHKLVLASTKQAPHRICIGRDIWAEVTLLHRKGSFQAFDWTFPDFGSGKYHPFLLAVRRRYREQLRQQHT